MSKYYLAPTRKGRMLKVVEDVRVPVSDKLQKIGRMQEAYLVKQRLVARFVNEDEAAAWLEAWDAANNIAFKLKYQCPYCGSRHISCWAESNIVLSSVDDSTTKVVIKDVDCLLDTQRCECLDCGKCGYLYRWEVK